MSKEGRYILGALCCLMLIVVMFSLQSEDAQTTLANGQRLDVAGETALEPKGNKSLEIEGLGVIAKDSDISNPFAYARETRTGKPAGSVNPEPSKASDFPAAKSTPKLSAPTGRETGAAQWKLKGVVIGTNVREAILSDGKEDKTVHIGDSFEGRTVTAIESDYIVYLSGGGEEKLWLLP